MWNMCITGILHMYDMYTNYKCNRSKTSHIYYIFITLGCTCLSPSLHISGFPKLISSKAKDVKPLFRPIEPTNPSFWMAYKGQSSFGITEILYTYRACKTLYGPTNPPIHQSEWLIKARAVSKGLHTWDSDNSNSFRRHSDITHQGRNIELLRGQSHSES